MGCHNNLLHEKKRDDDGLVSTGELRGCERAVWYGGGDNRGERIGLLSSLCGRWRKCWGDDDDGSSVRRGGAAGMVGSERRACEWLECVSRTGMNGRSSVRCRAGAVSAASSGRGVQADSPNLLKGNCYHWPTCAPRGLLSQPFPLSFSNDRQITSSGTEGCLFSVEST